MEIILAMVGTFLVGFFFGYGEGKSAGRSVGANQRLGRAVERHEARVWHVSDEPQG